MSRSEREVNYDYGTAQEIDSVMSRLTSIKDDDGSTVLASYKYLGAGRTIEENYEQADVKLSYLDASDNVTGLDRFGRVVDQLWEDYDAEESIDEYRYGYDRAGNRLWRENAVAGDLGTPVHLDERYYYDNVDRLTELRRGDVNTGNGTIVQGTMNFFEDWSLDAIGNWYYFGRDVHADGVGDPDDLFQDRQHNAANEVTGVDEWASDDWVNPAHDAAGNMIFSPKPGEGATGMHYVYDAWNRLAKVFEDTDDDGQYEPSTDEPLAAYEYDGANRRIEQLTDFVDNAPTVATHYFLSGENQVLETREGSPATAPESLGPKYQNVWSPRYVDSLILRDEYSGGVLQPASRLFYLADANYNVTALVGKVSETWQVVERYLYAAYGRVTVLDPTFLPDANNESDFGNTTLYTGRELDAATGLYYYRARYYDSELGRFIGRDPIGYEGSAWNLYEYVDSNPLRFTDFSGQIPIGPICRKLIPRIFPKLTPKSPMGDQDIHPPYLCRFKLKCTVNYSSTDGSPSIPSPVPVPDPLPSPFDKFPSELVFWIPGRPLHNPRQRCYEAIRGMPGYMRPGTVVDTWPVPPSQPGGPTRTASLVCGHYVDESPWPHGKPLPPVPPGIPKT